MRNGFSYKVPSEIKDIGFTPTLLKEFENRLLIEEDYSKITVIDEKIMFFGSSLGLEKYMYYFFQFSLDNFPKGFHIHEPCDPTEDFSSKELMLYKNEPNLSLAENNIFVDKNYFHFFMPKITKGNLFVLKKQLGKIRDKEEITVSSEDKYPSPGISASGEGFHKLGVILFLFIKLTDVQRFKIFNDLVLVKT